MWPLLESLLTHLHRLANHCCTQHGALVNGRLYTRLCSDVAKMATRHLLPQELVQLAEQDHTWKGGRPIHLSELDFIRNDQHPSWGLELLLPQTSKVQEFQSARRDVALSGSGLLLFGDHHQLGVPGRFADLQDPPVNALHQHRSRLLLVIADHLRSKQWILALVIHLLHHILCDQDGQSLSLLDRMNPMGYLLVAAFRWSAFHMSRDHQIQERSEAHQTILSCEHLMQGTSICEHKQRKPLRLLNLHGCRHTALRTLYGCGRQ
mmetsp:Transcript_7635/g.9495  ORF Transcript_7635/g.9495 Transcript_7635/m.9495 type:complete len:264 (-) Transcript_7635:245-1036(-)